MTASIHTQNREKFVESKRQPRQQSQYSNIALIHVGKTGGTTLLNNLLAIGCKAKATTIGVQQCQQKLQKQQQNIDDDNESQISFRTKYIVHYEKVFPIGNIKDVSSIRQILLSVSDAFIYTVREPISRFESAYYANSPLHCNSGESPTKKERTDDQKQCYQFQQKYSNTNKYQKYTSFYNNYPSLYNLSQSLLGKDWILRNNGTLMKTEDLLKQVFHHVGQSEFGHMTAGYQYYSQLTGLSTESNQQGLRRSPKRLPPIFAIRTEHLWKDVEYIDQKLGGVGNFTHLYDQKEVHIADENRINRLKLQDGSIEILSICCALRDEIRAYMNILRRAVNLNKYGKNPTETWKRCNVTDWQHLHERCQNLPSAI
jgi:hypothetical protein